jgi:tetratricopeptide (TPR) repeat protein
MNNIITYLQNNQKKLLIIPVLAVLGTFGYFAWNYQQEKQNTMAQSDMFQAVYQFEGGNYDKALQGDEAYVGFLDIIKNYRFTHAANLARFYAGVSYMHQANYGEAIRHLKCFCAKDFLLQARAWSLIGDASTEHKNYTQAIKYYLKAATHKPNEVYSPIYWVKAAVIYEAQADYKNAFKCYQNIVKSYPKSMLYQEAMKQVDRLEGLL